MIRSDVQLMLDVKAGDEASFDFLLQKYRMPLVNFLYRMVRDTATAEDLAQEVFLRVYRAQKTIYSEREVHHVALQDRNESGAEFGSRQSLPQAGNFARCTGGRGRSANAIAVARYAH